MPYKIWAVAALYFLMSTAVPFPAAAAAGEDSPAWLSVPGAEKIADRKLVIYIPQYSSGGKAVNQYLWANRAMSVLTGMAGRAMMTPPAVYWQRRKPGAPPLETEVMLVASYLAPECLTHDNMEIIGRLMKDMATENGLDHVYFEYDGVMYRMPRMGR
ncbi:hypothetical protein C4J81_14945 [Deltaproteobacteria bacterium Smac51]|nr:hypothetical protein C4J81_14945 [Deltaproteobacteria bacterium Smac51]